MADAVHSKATLLRKFTDWLLGLYNASAHTVVPFLTSPLLLKGILFGLLVTFIVSYARGSRQRLPPQPRRLPIFGNFFQLANRRWLYSRDCKERFGEIMYLDVLGKPTIIFNSLKSAFDVLERHASNSSGRPRFVMANEILSGGSSIIFVDHGVLWRRMRRASHEALSKVAVQRYHPIQTKEATIMVSTLLADPENREQHIQRTTASTIMSIIYDYPTLASGKDKTIQDIERDVQFTARAGVRTSFVEFFPWMVHVPERFAKWKREALEQATVRSKMFLQLFNRVKTDLVSVGVRPSFCASLIEHRDRYHLSEKEMALLAGQMYAAGFDTTATTLTWWILAMVAFPELQCRAQAELDAVVGRARLPTFSDAQRLPYVRATIREVIRWRPAVRLGTPHKTAEDEWYEGMLIPKGSTCRPNIWQCNRDRSIFGDDADEFKPERHLGDNGELLPGPKETNQEGHVSFGFGRRICVGKHLANESLFILTASILWAANLKSMEDEKGMERLLDTNAYVEVGSISHPPPHDCIITPRFPEVVSILAEERESFES